MENGAGSGSGSWLQAEADYPRECVYDFRPDAKQLAEAKLSPAHAAKVQVRHCLCLVFSLPFFAKTVPFLVVVQAEGGTLGWSLLMRRAAGGGGAAQDEL